MRKLLILIGVVIVVAGGALGYLWYDTHAQINRAMERLSPFAIITYGDASISPAGTVRVEDVVIQPRGVEGELRLDAVRFEFPNVFALLASNQDFSRNRLPKSLTIHIEPQGIGLNSAFLKHFLRPGDVPHATLCADPFTLTPAELQAMGYERLRFTASAHYNQNEMAKTLEADLRLDAPDLLAVTARAAVVAGELPVPLDRPPAVLPRVGKLDLALRDHGLNARRNQFCAQRDKLGVAESIAERVRLSLENLEARGATLGPGLIEAYRQYLKQGGEIKLTATPKRPIDLTALMPSDDPATMLGASLELDGQPVTDLTLALHAPKPPHAPIVTARAPATGEAAAPVAPVDVAESAAEPATDQPESVAEPATDPSESVAEPVTDQAGLAPVAPTVPSREPHAMAERAPPISLAQLDRYIGKTVLVTTLDGREYVGQIDGLINDALKLTMNIHKGTVVFTLKLDTIVSVNVLGKP